jgi:hypothetical protein
LRHAIFSICGYGMKVENSSSHIAVSISREEATRRRGWAVMEKGDVPIDIPQIGATVAEQINEDSTVESLIS